jgi:hypothetical protein
MIASNNISTALKDFFERDGYPMIFVGSGVSARAGLPIWKELVDKMADATQAFDPLLTQMMKQCLRENQLTAAVDHFNVPGKMLLGDKQKLLRSLLSKYDPAKISDLARLPFRACLTTNFDRCILDAIAMARHAAPIDFKFGDASFRQAQWEQNMFVARIHGAAEVPGSIVLSGQQLETAANTEDYQGFLRACFVQRNVLFIGFSFYDPAIRSVLEAIDRTLGPSTPGRHTALLPDGVDAELIQKANRLNIHVVRYSAANEHFELWKGIETFHVAPSPLTVTPLPVGPLRAVKQYFAACYARAKTSQFSQALKESLIEGIVSAMLQQAAPQTVRRAALLEKMRVDFGLKGKDAEKVVDAALRALLDAKLCRRMKVDNKVTIAWNGPRSDSESLASAIDTLSKSLTRRAMLQEGWQLGPQLIAALPSIFNSLVLTRGWDLGAAFAAGRLPEPVAIESAFNACNMMMPTFDRERLLRVFTLMMQHPSEEEAPILGELGRISFALEMAFQAPRSTLLHDIILPRRIYFDANVLLPAIVEGHPFASVYNEAISRLKSTASAGAIDLRLCICSVYLNEVISHKRNAEAYRKELGADFESISRSDALYHGASNSNVYVGAYATWIEKNQAISFEEFLRRFAPYSTEQELKGWLVARGFDIVDSSKVGKYSQVYGALERRYAGRLARGKTPVLIGHDAVQLARLDVEISRGEKVLFVTADRQLRGFVAELGLTEVAEGMLSNVGLLQLIELSLGGMSGSAGMTELLWNARLSTGATSFRFYYTTLALEKYDAGMAMTLPDIVENFSEQTAAELNRNNFDLEAIDPTARARAFRALGSLGKNYFDGMTKAVDEYRKKIDAAD